jgi:endophilin-A
MLPKRQFVISIQEFKAEQSGDLGFGVGERITIISSVDENWYEGELHGQRGIFPKSFVKSE